jgi:Zn-dependent M28 family amino/carboxypeptidase
VSRILQDALKAHVFELSSRIGERNVFRPEALASARDYLRRVLTGYGLPPRIQTYAIGDAPCENLEALLAGTGGIEMPRLVVGAHYDTAPGTPGADDNASGVAALLELARLLKGKALRRPAALAFFSTEEPPFFGTDAMGSRFYAREARRRGDKIEGMICLEMVGCYSTQPGRQSYPPFLKYLFPDRADFLGLVGNLSSRRFLKRVREALEGRLKLPLQHAVLPAWVPGVDLSDHRSFWAEGWPAVMLTDTAFYRNPRYHERSDAWDTLDYASMAAVVEGLAGALEAL